jgi:hypothetical protein
MQVHCAVTSATAWALQRVCRGSCSSGGKSLCLLLMLLSDLDAEAAGAASATSAAALMASLASWCVGCVAVAGRC